MIKKKEIQYPVALTWKQIWIALTVLAGILGSIFAAGIKVQYEVSRVELAKMEQRYQEDLCQLKLTLGREARESEENLVFFKNQYHAAKERLDICLEKGEYTESTDK